MKRDKVLKSRFSAIIYALFSLTSPLTAETQQCEDPSFQVTADDPLVLKRTCQVASRARKKLATCGVELKHPIRIGVRDRVQTELGDCLGVYHCGSDSIDVLSPSAMSEAREDGSPFKLVSDSAFWESVIVHELTHAVYDTVPCPFSSCIATSEYASYVMQVWSLPEAERRLFGSGVELRTKPVRDAISAMVLYMSPDRFAVIAWRHFQARPDQCGYMGYIMNGKIYFDREPR